MGRAEELHTCSRNCTQGDVETGWMLDMDPIPHVQVIRRRWKFQWSVALLYRTSTGMVSFGHKDTPVAKVI